MQTIFENLGTKPIKRNYLSSFISLLMPLIWLFLPQIFVPLKTIETFIFGSDPISVNTITLQDVASILYFGIGILIGMIATGLPNKKIPTIIFATIGIMMNMFLLLGICFEIRMREGVINF